jgi:hypothetical protein
MTPKQTLTEAMRQVFNDCAREGNAPNAMVASGEWLNLIGSTMQHDPNRMYFVSKNGIVVLDNVLSEDEDAQTNAD